MSVVETKKKLYVLYKDLYVLFVRHFPPSCLPHESLILEYWS